MKNRLLLMPVLAAILISAVLVVSGCKKEEQKSAMKSSSEEKTSENTEKKDSIVIGISKFVQHPALDAVEKGIQDELADLGWDNITYDLQNANADANTSAQIATKFKSEGVNVAVGIATPTSQALVKVLKDIPVIYTAVTDPVSAGLVTSYDQGGENVTGYSDMTPVKAQLELLNQIVPVKRLGHVYTSGEMNAVILAEKAKAVCADMGIEFIESTVTNSSEVKQAAQSIADRVDAFYVSTDNTVVSALSSLCDVAMKKGKPVMSADPSSAQEFEVLAALGFDYYKHGRACGRLIDKILKGASTKSIPTQYMSDPNDVDQLLLNLDVANALNITIPEDILSRANMVRENGKLEKK